jgi:hypothetical protein
MPLNEAGPPRSNLTRQQKHEAMAAIYGLQEIPQMNNQGPQAFSAHEIERMRAIINHHDSKQKAAVEFDLNNPPRTNYVHQPFPKLVYNLDRDDKPVHKLVHDADEHEAAIAAGWENEPMKPAEVEETELNPADAAEAAKVDGELKKKKKAAK